MRKHIITGEYWRIISVNFEGAISNFNKAIELKENYAEAYNNRAVAKINSGDYNGASMIVQKQSI